MSVRDENVTDYEYSRLEDRLEDEMFDRNAADDEVDRLRSVYGPALYVIRDVTEWRRKWAGALPSEATSALNAILAETPDAPLPTRPDHLGEAHALIEARLTQGDWLSEGTVAHVTDAVVGALTPLLTRVAKSREYTPPTFDFRPEPGDSTRESFDGFVNEIIWGFNLPVTGNPDVNRTDIAAGDLYAAVHDALDAAGYIEDAAHTEMLARLNSLFTRLADLADEGGLIDQHVVLIPLAKIISDFQTTDYTVTVDLNGDIDVSTLGGRVFTLDDMAVADGYLDPLIFIHPLPEAGRVLDLSGAMVDAEDLVHPGGILDPFWFADESANIVLDPTADVNALGGHVIPIEINGDGLLDPLRISATPADGIELATSIIVQANPFGARQHEFDAPLRTALTYGVGAGATCVGDALRIALDANEADPVMVDQILALADTSPMFRTLIGYDVIAGLGKTVTDSEA